MKGYVKSKPKQPRVTNPFMKEDVKLISDELTNSVRENLNEAITPPKRPKAKQRPGPRLHVGSARG